MPFGPRQAGKSSDTRSQLADPPAAFFSLLDQRLLLSLQLTDRPEDFESTDGPVSRRTSWETS